MCEAIGIVDRWGEMIDLSHAPAPLRALQQWLAANDFRAVPNDVPRDACSEFLSGGRRIEIRFDRGEWSLSLGVDPMPNAYHPDEWEAWLDRLPLGRHLSPIDQQVEFIVSRWARALARASSDFATAQIELETIGLDWVERRFGWRPGA